MDSYYHKPMTKVEPGKCYVAVYTMIVNESQISISCTNSDTDDKSIAWVFSWMLFRLTPLKLADRVK